MRIGGWSPPIPENIAMPGSIHTNQHNAFAHCRKPALRLTSLVQTPQMAPDVKLNSPEHKTRANMSLVIFLN